MRRAKESAQSTSRPQILGSAYSPDISMMRTPRFASARHCWRRWRLRTPGSFVRRVAPCGDCMPTTTKICVLERWLTIHVEHNKMVKFMRAVLPWKPKRTDEQLDDFCTSSAVEGSSNELSICFQRHVLVQMSTLTRRGRSSMDALDNGRARLGPIRVRPTGLSELGQSEGGQFALDQFESGQPAFVRLRPKKIL